MNRFTRIALIVSISLSCGLMVTCQNKRTSEDAIVARAGDRIIDWNELHRSFQLQPKWGKGLTYKQAYLNQLNFLIDQKLFAQAAISEDLDKETEILGYIEFIRKKEMIKELYRQQVASKVEISEKEYQNAYLNMKKKIKFNYIYTPSLTSAQNYKSRLGHSDFSSIILLDLNHDVKGTSPDFTFGDLAPELEQVVFNMKAGEVSGPIAVAGGYMVVQVIDGSVDIFLSQWDLVQKKNKIRKVIFDRKAAGLANKFVKELMRNKDLQLNPDVFYALSAEFSRIVENKVSENPIPVFISNEEIKSARKHLNEMMDEVLITYADGQMTVREFLTELWNMPADLRPRVKMGEQLKNAIGVIVRNKYLAKRAEKLGLRRSSEVIRQTRIQADEILARTWLAEKRNHLSSDRQEIENFKTTSAFQHLQAKIENPLSNEQIADLILDFKLAQLKLQVSDSLKAAYHVNLDTIALYKQIPEPQKVIDYDPAKFVVRELFY
jgi:hypothetical protein